MRLKLRLLRLVFSEISHNCQQTLHEPFVYVGLSGVLQQDRVHNDGVNSPDAVNATDPLLQDHRIPGQIEMNQPS